MYKSVIIAILLLLGSNKVMSYGGLRDGGFMIGANRLFSEDYNGYLVDYNVYLLGFDIGGSLGNTNKATIAKVYIGFLGTLIGYENHIFLFNVSTGTTGPAFNIGYRFLLPRFNDRDAVYLNIGHSKALGSNEHSYSTFGIGVNF